MDKNFSFSKDRKKNEVAKLLYEVYERLGVFGNSANSFLYRDIW